MKAMKAKKVRYHFIIDPSGSYIERKVYQENGLIRFEPIMNVEKGFCTSDYELNRNCRLLVKALNDKEKAKEARRK